MHRKFEKPNSGTPLKFTRLLAVIIFLSLSQQAWAQVADTSTVVLPDSLSNDSMLFGLDSVLIENDTTDSLLSGTPAKRQSVLEDEVKYSANDSMRIDLVNQMVYLFGDAVAIYGDIELKANYIEISLKQNELYAKGLPDSTGTIVGEPIFKQGSQEFEAGEMRYNFKSKRGLSKHVKTQESGGFLHGETVKRDTGEIIYIKNGKYTTCEYDDPHFHIHAQKLKVIPQDKIITGPAYLSIADIPTPLVVPFGFFPNSEDQSNGLIIPTWGEAVNQGFYLGRGGYYFGVKDVMDFSITGDIYSRGSWAAYVDSRYVKRYRFNGNYGLEFVQSKFSEREYPDFYSQNTFNVRWRHQQDAKARPGSNFSADVNAGSSKNNRNNIQSSADNYLRSQMNSSIRYSKSFANTPFSIAVAATGSQNTQTEVVNLRAPDVSFNMARIFPFKPKSGIASPFAVKSGLDKLGLNAGLDMSNRLEGREDTLFNNYNNKMLKSMDNGIRLNSTASTNIKILKYLTLSPSTSHRIVGYRQSVDKTWNADSNRVATRQVEGLTGFYDGSASISLNTIVYGTYQYKNQVIKAMRHQMTPSASVSYRPDYSAPAWGYFGSVQSDSLGNTTDYSFFEGRMYGGPSAQENGVINLSLNNTFELKVRNRKDTTGEKDDKKLKLLDAFNFNTNYNIAKDSLNWNPLQVSLRTQVFEGLVINGSATLDPYAINPVNGRRLNEFQIERNNKLGRWTRAQVAFSYNIRPKGSSKKQNQNQKETALSDANMYYTDFVDFDVPWSMNINYNIQYTNNGLNENISQVVDLRGETNITRNWKVSFRTGFDIKEADITFSQIEIYRNLHCWEFSLGIVPFGPRQNYNFQINVKSAILQDLKLNRRRNFAVPERG
ncbi:MAG: putative LPS assembly protein LptD [Salibacteraceae bacterium]